MSNGRIESYLHSDRSTPNKVGVLIKVTCQTDFAAKTDEFIAFTKWVARLACGYLQSEDELTWERLVRVVGWTGEQQQTLDTELAALSALLKEKIAVEDIVILRL
jgi:translation elongation factor EF-Ts